jgi:arylsulfatase A-like enzyme
MSTFNRRDFIKAAGVGLSGLVLPGCVSSLEGMAKGRPNIVFIFTDDHTSQSIGAYGSRLAGLNTTPNIDRIAKEGMLFEKFFVGNSICAPSRATLLTGKHSHMHGKIDNRGGFNHDQQTFPKLMQKAGYATAIFGKTHLPGSVQGFDDWETLIGQGDYYQPVFETADGKKQYEGYVTDIITDRSLKWLKEDRKDDKPFMLMVHHKATHRTWCPALRHLHKFDDVEIPYPDNFFDEYEGRYAAKHQDMSIEKSMNLTNDLKVKTKEYRKKFDEKRKGRKGLPGREKGAYFRMTAAQRKVWDGAYDPKNEEFAKAKLTGKELTKWKYQRYMKDYLRTATAVDEGIGRILDYLDESGLSKNTIVMYSSDQGFYLGEHGWFDKRFMYEESFKAPLVVRWPGVVRAGSVSRDLTQNIDFAETFLDIAETPIPEDMQGVSMVPVLRGKTPKDWRRSLYYRYYEYPGVHSVRRHEGVAGVRFKLIRFFGKDVPGDEMWEFYDLENDPSEMENIYGQAKWTGKIAEMKKELTRLRKLYKVTD